MLSHPSTASNPHLQDPNKHALGQASHDQLNNDLNNRYDVLKQTMPGVTIQLKPIAAPMALGLAAFFSGSWIFATWYADWYGSNITPVRVGSFILLFGGLAQFLAGMACFPARDNWASVMHTTWGAFFSAWGIYAILVAQNALTLPLKYGSQQEIAMMLVCMAAIDLMLCLTSYHRDLILMITLLFHFIGDVLMFGGFFDSNTDSGNGDDNPVRTIKAGAYFWIVSSLIGLYRCLTWLVLENFQHSWLPVFATPHEKAAPRVRVPVGEPGIKKGQ